MGAPIGFVSRPVATGSRGPLGEEIRRLRLAAGLSQGQAAKLAGFELKSWSDYEVGRHIPLLPRLKRMARVVGGKAGLLGLRARVVYRPVEPFPVLRFDVSESHKARVIRVLRESPGLRIFELGRAAQLTSKQVRTAIYARDNRRLFRCVLPPGPRRQVGEARYYLAK